ncbi:transcriptional regulator [Pectobacterium phage ZF40]|uniref:transcriptional regulator n=1 Tax=Pectobacterium phage ZF40 TaxID=1127516 RepID=UPI0002536E61|nr:hypothetical protein [Pectobacterium carotovorum]YP_007006931.1 transcriptional regulator [Pectobacterium phage ZF40]AFC22474.1 hypothetical protein ZF40_0022 [Pectobacterium phage ZF40]ULS51800.1 hypothetical protein GBN63_19375 [Pectobacterium carotovorum]
MTNTKERAAARKRAQRKRQREAGVTKLELNLDAQELEMLRRNCAARRPGKEPYDMDEYIQMLIRQDDARVRQKIKAIGHRICGKCGESLPVDSCCMTGDSACWNTSGWHEMKLII